MKPSDRVHQLIQGGADEFQAICQTMDENAVIATTPPLPVMTWDEVQNMVYNSTTGAWESNNNTGLGSLGALRKKLVGVGYGKTVVCEFTRRNKHPRIANMKFLRVWNNLDVTKYPNFYIGQPGGSNGSWLFLYTESLSIDINTRININSALYPLGDDQWHKEHYEWKYPSAYGKTDGTFKILIDGNVVLNDTAWQCEGTDDAGKVYQGLPYDVFIQTDIQAGAESAGVPWPIGSYSQVKGDVLISVT